MARPRKNVVKDQNALLTPDNVVEIPVEEQPYPLLEGWKWVRLHNLCSLRNGKAFKPSDWSDSGLPIIRIQNLNNPDSKFNYYSGYIEDKFLISSGDVLFAWSGTPGTSFGAHIWYGGKAVLNQHIFRIDFKGKVILKSFFRYSINCRLEELIAKAHGGAGLQHVTKGVFENTPIPLPSIDEQQRIVDRIESLFAKLDEAREKAEAVLDGFESRKAAILHKAFTGELTAKWREKNGLKKENKAIKIKDILLDIKYGTSEKSDYTYTGLPVIRIPNIIDNTIDLDDLKFLKSNDSSNYDLVEKNDILMIRSNGSRELVGKCALVDETIVGKAYASFLIRLRPKKSVNAKYLLNFMSSSLARNQLFSKTKSSVGINNINSKEICSVDIWLPTTEEQQEIVRTLDTLLEKERQVKEAAEDVLERIDLMKKAILAKAFRGELTR